MKNQTQHAPAFPTFPIQDNLGQIIVNFGASKLEIAACIVAAGVARHVDNLLPETVADMAVEIARAIIDKCEAQQEQDTKPQTPQIIL